MEDFSKGTGKLDIRKLLSDDQSNPLDSSEKRPTSPVDLFQEANSIMEGITEAAPRIDEQPQSGLALKNLQEILEVSLFINSSLDLKEVLRKVMERAIELMNAERGMIIPVEDGTLKFHEAHQFSKGGMTDDDVRFSKSIATKVAVTGDAIYTSDAQSDEKYQDIPSITELNLRSIMCVPIKLKEEIIGVIYLDNSNEKGMFLQSDLSLFQVYAQMAANALHNAQVHSAVNRLQHYTTTVIETVPVGIIVLDTKGRVATMNPAALEIFELDRGKVRMYGQAGTASYFGDLLPDSERARWQYMINTALTTKTEYADARFFHNTAFVEKALSIKISPISALPDGGDGLIMAVEDVTEKVVIEKHLILSEKLVAKGEMAATIAHELNNYLQIAATNAELLSMNIDAKNYEKAKFSGNAIVENIFRIKRFVDGLNDSLKVETEYIMYDVRHLIEDLLFSLRPHNRFRYMQFSLDLAKDLPTSEIDVGQVQQVLLNLLNNAADATEERAVTSSKQGLDFTREISISASYDAGHDRVRVDVSDNGIGMSEETMKKIFMIYYSTKKTGHGLGLYHCKKIVNENHHGELLVSSTLGQGTTFTLLLPRFQKKPVETPA